LLDFVRFHLLASLSVTVFLFVFHKRHG
jgi:hypothetical protein